MAAKRLFTRRAFTKASLASITAAALSGGAPCVLAQAEDTGSEGEIKRIRSCCRACGKMECGVWVLVQNGRVVRTEGDESAFQSEGNHCSKGQASVQAAYHPDRLRYPMKRTAPKGEDPGWVRISWDEAWETIGSKLNELKERYGGECLFAMGGTSRVYAQGAYANLPQLMGTPNTHVALQICKGPRLFAGSLVNDMGLFWYEGTMRPKVYVQWGTACEYSNYDDSCRTIVATAQGADCHILIDPRTTPLGKEADYWVSLRPGTDGAIAMCWTNLVIQNELYDKLFVKRWTNGPVLVVEDQEPSGGFVMEGRGGIDFRTRLLKESDIVEGGSYLRFMCWDNVKAAQGKTGNEALTYFDNETHVWEGETFSVPTEGEWIKAHDPRVADAFMPKPSTFNPEKDPALFGEFEVTLKDGRTVKARPVWDLYAERCAEYTPEKTAEITGADAGVIEESCIRWATPISDDQYWDKESFSIKYGNGGLHYQLAPDQTGNCTQTIRALAVLSAITGNTDTPGGNRGQTRIDVDAVPGIRQMNLGPVPAGVTNLMINAKQCSVEKYPLVAWFNWWADATSIWDAVHTGNPYPIRGGVCETGNFMSQSNAMYGWEALKKLDFFVQADLWHAPSTSLADVILPVAHWLELNSTRTSQGASGASGCTVKAIDPPGEAIDDITLSVQINKACGRNFNDVPGKEWPTNTEVLDWCVSLFRGGGYDWSRFQQEFQETGWFDAKAEDPIWANYHRWEMGMMRQQGHFNKMPNDGFPGFYTPTGLTEIWSTVIETLQPGEDGHYILPGYDEPWRSPVTTPEAFEEYPLLLTSGSRSPVFFHSEHRQLPWCRELWPVPRLELNPADAEELGIEQGDWVWIENEEGKIRQVADVYYGIKPGVVNANHTWWYPENKAPGHGWELSAINCLVHKDEGDPLCGASTLRAYPVKVYKATPENSPFGNPCPCDADGTPVISDANDPRLKDWMPNYEGRE